MKIMMISVLMWWLIIAFAAVSFYLVYPKYELHPRISRLIINSITGELFKGTVKKSDPKLVPVGFNPFSDEQTQQEFPFEDWDKELISTQKEESQ